MARIKKYADNVFPHLTDYQTFITDTNPNSYYFRITEFNETLTGGKNGFLIEGSEHLLESTEIKIEILDVNGDPIYFEPGDGVPEYYEGLSKVIAVHIYEDVPIGNTTITILGELKTYVNSFGNIIDVPNEWKGIYNVKWEKSFKTNRLLPNEDRVRFYKRPSVNITELIKPLYSNIVAQKTNTGNVSGIPLAPLENRPLSEYSLPTSYLLTITDNGSTNAWSSSVVDNLINIPSLGYTTTAQEIINKTQLIVTNPYTDANGLVQPFSNLPYTTTFNYLEGVNDLKTALTGSFAKINITDLTSFVGDVARVKVFRKSQSDLSDFQFIQEIQLEANELLLDLDTSIKNQENYGIFTTNIIKDYWVTSSNNLVATFNQSYLYDSVKLNSNSNVYKFHTSKSLSITKGVEYTLDFKVRSETSIGDGYIRAFISGSKGNLGNTVQIEQNIVNIPAQTSILQKSTVTQNIIADELATASLYFEVKGNDWYVSDISLKASQESSFSPDEITFIQSVPRTLPEETFIYRFEFYDINNNYIPVNVEKIKTFNGGNLQTIRKGLQLKPSSLYFQFDSGSQPVPPTIISIDVIKTLLTGSVTYTSKSFDFDGNELFAIDYASYITNGGGFPGLLNNINSDTPSLTVQHFTGSRLDKNVQYLEITGEVEGFTDTVVITKVLDGFGGVNHIIRPYRGSTIRNSSTASLEIQAVRIDGINEIELSSTTNVAKNFNTYQLHILSQSNDLQYFINLQKAVNQNYIKGLVVGELGSKELNYNAIFNRDSIDKVRTVYLIQSSSAITGQPAYIVSSSVLASIALEDLQDGLDSGFFTFNTENFTINPRTETVFTPVSASVTGLFYKRGTNVEAFTASFEVFPSMSLNADYEPQYWMYYVTGKFHPNISVVAIDEKKREIPSRAVSSYIYSPISQSKILNVKLTYTEDYTSASISIDKTFTIVPQGKPGDETVVFEVVPANVTLNSNSEGIVLDYKPSITDIKLKQGSRYLAFTSSREAGTFHIASSSRLFQNITPGNIHFTSSFGVQYTASLIVSQSSNFTQLSGSITYPLIIHPYYTSSIYTQSIVQNYTKAVDGPPPIDVIITPTNPTLNADENSFVSTYAPALTNIQLREGGKFLVFNSASTSPGTFRFGSTPTQNITISTLGGNSTTTATASFSLFNYPYVSASVVYNIIAYPYSLGPGHAFTSSVLQRTQRFTKNVAAAAARSVNLTSTAYTITYDSDGQVINPTDGVVLVATAFNTTGSKYYQFFKDDIAQTPIQTSATKTVAPEDVVAPGEIATWKVTLRDGSSSATAPIRAQASITIAGVKDGSKAYNAVVNPENTSVVYKVSGELEITNTSAVITATKGGEALTHKPSGFSAQSQDPFGNNIGSLGEYQVKIHSKSTHITLGDGKVSGSTLNGSTNATISNIDSWFSPETNPTAQIVYRVDFENGKLITYKTQSIAIQYEGAVGPGIVMRGVWNNSTNYIGSVETTNYRRDAVIWPDPGNSGGNTQYYAAISGSGPATYDNNGVLVNYHAPDTTPADNAWWQYLGAQEFFVAAKIAIFDESFVKNTINIGNNAGSSFANIVLAGGRDDPFMSIGQNGTVGGNNIQYNPSTYPAVIGYDKIGIFAGMFNNSSVYEPRFSLRSSGGNYLRWNGTSLDINGSINASSGTFTGFVTAGGVQLGPGVNSGTANGIFINANNYWYDTGNFSLGNGSTGVTWNGSALNVTGTINASGGNFSGFVTAGTMKIGANVDSTNNGIYINANNYWYDTGIFKIGGSTNYAIWNGTTFSVAGDITAQSGTFTGYMSASTFKIGKGVIGLGYDGLSDGNYSYWTANGQIALLANASDGLLIVKNGIVSYQGNLLVTTPANYDSNHWYSYVTIGVSPSTFGVLDNDTMYLGRGVNGSNNGIYINSTNYWYAGSNSTNPSMKADIVGGSISGITSLAVSGAITATGNITAYFSDNRLKNRLSNIVSSLDMVKKLNGFYYTNNDLANSFGYLSTERQVGLSAQEVQNVLPEAVSIAPIDRLVLENGDVVSKSGENYLTIDYSKLVPILVEAIKELKKEIDILKNNR